MAQVGAQTGRVWFTQLAILFLILMAGCGGDYSGGTVSLETSETDTDRSLTPVDDNPEDELKRFFYSKIEPQMEYCGVCHSDGGVADSDAGRRFKLDSSHSHYDSFRMAWSDLGQGVESNLLLIENSDASEPHTGGKTWPSNSVVYENVKTLLLCWDQPDACPLFAAANDSDDQITPTSSLPLLGSSHGNHLWNQFCAEQSDDTRLPQDPRSLVTPGVNNGKAVYYNAYYEDCHVNLAPQERAPQTCGEYRKRVEQGDFFANQRAAMTDLSIPATTLNGLWKQWGYSERPENFDQLLTQRYGFNPAPFANPYPLPGEDPVNTNGGSGSLPLGLIQGRDEMGNYNGRISLNCYICHGGQIGFEQEGEGLGTRPGMGNTNTDMMIFMRDISGGMVGGLLPISLNNTRGTSNAVGAFDLLTLIWDVDTLSLSVNPFKLPFTHSYHGNQDMPNWWNTSHRPRKFFDGGVSVDATRIDMAAADQVNLLQSGATRRSLTEQYDQDLQAYVDAQVAPKFPGDIDTKLAEQGAIIFHNKDLWADQQNSAIPRPQGNGSCAGCHGAYSPRYVNDPRFLESPALEGIASYLVPLEIIQTDPARALSISSKVREVFRSTWWGYPDGVDGYVPPQEKDAWDEYKDDFAYPIINPEGRPVQGACGWIEEFGYLAPPLYGVWASSPYFHNGSVPTLRQVLQPQQRPKIWRRYDAPIEGNVKGYDMSLQAYDLTDQVGWKYYEYCDGRGDASAHCDADNTVTNNRLYRWLEGFKDDI